MSKLKPIDDPDYKLFLKWRTKFAKLAKKARKGGVCLKCGVKYESLSIDHIVPLAILDSFVRNKKEAWYLKYEFEENFEIMCWQCNERKGMFLDFTNPKTIKILDELLQPYREGLIPEERKLGRMAKIPKREK